MLQVPAVYLVQHAMLVGLTLPFYGISVSTADWTAVDTVATAAACAGLAIAARADSQLHTFVSTPHSRSAVLCSGLWSYSRHPNHFGELQWWWAVWLFSVPAGHGWTVVGTAFNTACIIQVRLRFQNLNCSNRILLCADVVPPPCQ